MPDPFAPYYYKEEEYDLDKFINDYRDILNTHQPEFFKNTSGEIKEETFKTPMQDDPEVELFALPVGLSNKEIFGEEGIPKELFKTMNAKDVAGALRASNPALYNNYSDDELLNLGRDNGFNVDELIYNDNQSLTETAYNGLRSFWNQSNVGPWAKANWAKYELMLEKEAQGMYDEESDQYIVGSSPFTTIGQAPGKIYEMVTGKNVDWNQVKKDAIQDQQEVRQNWQDKIKEDPNLRGYLRWKEDNPTEWDNWYDPKKLTDVAFNTLPSWVLTMFTGAAATYITRGKSWFAPMFAMWGVSGGMEGSSVSEEMTADLMENVPVDNAEFNEDVKDYQTSLITQLTEPDYDGIDYLNDEENYGKYDRVVLDGKEYTWSNLPKVKQKEFLDKKTNEFVQRKYSKGNKGEWIRKGLSAEEAFDATNTNSLIHAAVSGAIEVIPGVELGILRKMGLLNPAQKIAGFSLFKRSKNLAKINYKLPKGLQGPNSKAAISSIKGGIYEGLEEIGQYGSQLFTTTTLPYKDPDSGGWKYGTSRESFGEKWNWSEAMEGFLGGFLLGGGTGVTMSGARALGTYTGVTPKWHNRSIAKNTSDDSYFVTQEKGDEKFKIARHVKKGDKYESEIVPREDLDDYIPDAFDSFKEAFAVTKVMNEKLNKDKMRINWGHYGKYHNSEFFFEGSGADEKIVWLNSSGERFEETLLSEIESQVAGIDTGDKGVTRKEATKRAKKIKSGVARLYRALDGDFTIEQSGFTIEDGESVWDAPYGEQGFAFKLGNDGKPIIGENGMPILEKTTVTGPKTVDAMKLSAEEEKQAIEDLKRNNQGGFTSLLTSLFKSKKKPKFKPIVSAPTTYTDEDEQITTTVPSSADTKLKVQGFLGVNVKAEDAEKIKKIEEEGTFGNYDKMKEGISDYSSVEEFEKDTGQSFDNFAREMNVTFPNKPSITEDIFIKQQDKEEDFITKQSKGSSASKVPTPPKSKNKYAGMSLSELESLLKEKNETLSKAKGKAGKTMLGISIKAIEKEIESRKGKPKDKKIEDLGQEGPKYEVDIDRKTVDKIIKENTTKEGWEIDESNIVSLQTKQDTRLDNFENQLKDKYGLKKYDVVKDDEDVDALWTYDYVETEEAWSMDNAYVTDLAKKTLNPQELKKLEEMVKEYNNIDAAGYEMYLLDKAEKVKKRVVPKPKSKAEATTEEVRNIVNKLSEKFNLLNEDGTSKINVVMFDEDSPFDAEYVDRNNIDLSTNVGWWDSNTNTLYINPELAAKRALDTPFHEFMHPFISQMRLSNPKLFKSLYDELNNPDNTFGQGIFKKVRAIPEYAKLEDTNFDAFMEEIIVTAIGDSAKNSHLNYIKNDKGLKAWLKRLYQWFKELLFGKSATVNAYVRPWELSENTTISELSEMLADLDGIYNFELLSTDTFDSMLEDSKKQVGLEEVNVNQLFLNPNFNIESLDKLEGLEWVQAHTQLILEVQEVMGDFTANMFDASKKLRSEFLKSGSEVTPEEIKKVVEKYIDNFMNNFDTILESKFKIPKKGYKPTSKTLKHMTNNSKNLSELFKNMVEKGFESSFQLDDFNFHDFVKTRKFKLLFDSPKFKQRAELFGRKIENYINLVKFNYGFIKMIENKSGKISISDLQKDKFGGVSLKKKEQEIVKNEFIPYIKETFPGVKSISSEVLQEEYKRFMSEKYGIHKYKAVGYEGALNWREAYGYGRMPLDERHKLNKGTEEFRYILTNKGFYTAQHGFSAVPFDFKFEDGKTLEELKGNIFQGVNGMGWYTVKLITNNDNTVDVIGFEFQTDVLDKIIKAAKQTNFFGEKEVYIEGSKIIDPYYTLLSHIWHNESTDSDYIAISQGTKSLLRSVDNYVYPQYFSILMELMGKSLNGELQYNEVELFVKAVTSEKIKTSGNKGVYPWEGTKSPLSNYRVTADYNLSNRKKFNQTDVERIINEFTKNKNIVIHPSYIDGLNNQSLMANFAALFGNAMHEFRARNFNVDRNFPEAYSSNVLKVIFSTLKNGNNEDRLKIHNLFTEIYESAQKGKHLQTRSIVLKMLDLPGVSNALKHAEVNMLGLGEFSEDEFLNQLGFPKGFRKIPSNLDATKNDAKFEIDHIDSQIMANFDEVGAEPYVNQTGFDLLSFLVNYYFAHGTKIKPLVNNDGTKNNERFNNRNRFVLRFDDRYAEDDIQNLNIGEPKQTIADLPMYLITQQFYNNLESKYRKWKIEKTKWESFTTHTLPLIAGAMNTAFSSDNLESVEKAAQLAIIRDELGPDGFAYFEKQILKYLKKGISRDMSDLFRKFYVSTQLIPLVHGDEIVPGKIKNVQKDGMVLMGEKDWMKTFDLTKEDLSLNKMWASHFDTWFDKVIRLWMVDSQKYNGEKYLMSGFNTTIMERSWESGKLYLTFDEANLLNVLYNESIGKLFTMDETLYSKLSPNNQLIFDALHSQIPDKTKESRDIEDSAYWPDDKSFATSVVKVFSNINTISFVNSILEDALVDSDIKFDINKSNSEQISLFYKAVSSLRKNLLELNVDLNTFKPGAFSVALAKIAKKEGVNITYDTVKGLPEENFFLKVDLSNVKTDKLRPLYFKRIKNEQLNIKFPVTEEQVLDNVDTYIRDYYTTKIMDSRKLFSNILKDFKVVAKNRYGYGIVDSEIFKMAMLNQLNAYPTLKDEFIIWHDSVFSNEGDTKENKKLGTSKNESAIEDTIANDYAYTLSTIFEDFKELGRFDEIVSGDNSNENYYNILDFSWLQELGIDITNDRYNRLLRKARISESFLDFMDGIETLLERFRFNSTERKRLKKFWNRAKSNISVNNKNAERKNWCVIKESTGWGKDSKLRKVNRKGTENVIKKTTNPQWDRKTIFEHNEKHFPNIFEWIGKSDVFFKKNETEEQLVQGEINKVRESYEFFTEGEIFQLNAQLNKEDRTIAFIRGDSKKIAIVKIHNAYKKIAENKQSLTEYWETEQRNGYIPKNEDGGDIIIKELTTGTSMQLAENIARHVAYKIAWPKYKFYPATTFMKRIKIATTPGTFSDVRDFNAMFYNPKKATIVYKDGSKKELYKNIDGVGLKYIGDGGDFVGKDFMSAYRIANGLKDNTIEMKTSIWQKNGDSVIMFKHNSFLVNKDMEIYEDYGKPTQRLIAKVENYVIKTPNGEIVDMLSTDDEVKVFDGHGFEEIVNIKGSSMVTSFYNEDASNKASHGMQWYNYMDDNDILNALWNPENGIMTLSIRKDLAELYSLGIETEKGKTIVKKIEDFLEKIIGKKDLQEDGFLPTVLEYAKIGAGLHPVVSTALDKLIQTRIIKPALNLKSRPGAKLVIRPNTDPNLKKGHISIPKHALGPALSRIANSLNVKSNELTIDMINEWLSKDSNVQKLLLYRTPIASVLGAGVYRIQSVHNNKNVILIHEDNVFYDLEADQDADKVQIEYLDDSILDMMEEYISNVEFKRHPLSKFVPEGFDNKFSMNSTKDIAKLMAALTGGQNGIQEIAKAASIYGILKTWFGSMTINGRKVILTPSKGYKMNWPVYYNGKKGWEGTFPELLYIYLQASADNAEFMLLSEWGYKREDLYRMMFKYEDDMKNINDEDLKIAMALVSILKKPSNIRRGGDYDSGNYFAKHTFEQSKQYSAFSDDRFGYLSSLLTLDKYSKISSELNELITYDNLHPLEIVAMMPHKTRNISEYNNHILSSGHSPLHIPDSMHLNAHNDAKFETLKESYVEHYIDGTLNTQGVIEGNPSKYIDLSKSDKDKYIKGEYNKALKYVRAMKNDFFNLLIGKDNHNYSSMDRDEKMIAFKEKYDRKFKKLSATAKAHATFWFLDGFQLVTPSGKNIRAKVLKVLPPVSKNKNAYSLLDWKVMSKYFKEYNQSIKNKRDTQKALESNVVKHSYKKTIKEICGRL